jgi:hypothetical protein
MRATGVDPQAMQDRARQMFRRAVARWACDMLVLQRDGLDTPGPRLGRGLTRRLPMHTSSPMQGVFGGGHAARRAA